MDWRKNQMSDMSGNGNTGQLIGMSTSQFANPSPVLDARGLANPSPGPPATIDKQAIVNIIPSFNEK